jgi:hypothetical protein
VRFSFVMCVYTDLCGYYPSLTYYSFVECFNSESFRIPGTTVACRHAIANVDLQLCNLRFGVIMSNAGKIKDCYK